jgi:ethanolamine utilization protein EutP
MKRAILIGKHGSGKTALVQRMERRRITGEKTQMVSYHDAFIDTPGEYMEMRNMYRALIVSAADADVVALLHPCPDDEPRFPPGFASIFSKEVVGIVSKTDLAREGDIERASEILEDAGVNRIFRISALMDAGIDELAAFLGDGALGGEVGCATNC